MPTIPGYYINSTWNKFKILSGQQRQAGYTANNLNQYSSRVVPGALDIIGIAIWTNSVTVNGNSAAYRRGEYYWSPLTVGNGSGPVWQK